MLLESFDGIQMHVFYKVVMSKVYKCNKLTRKCEPSIYDSKDVKAYFTDIKHCDIECQKQNYQLFFENNCGCLPLSIVGVAGLRCFSALSERFSRCSVESAER